MFEEPKTKTVKADNTDNQSAIIDNGKPQELDPMIFAIFGLLLRVKKAVTVAPTNVPRNFLEQIQFFDDGVDRKLYIYINGTWRVVAMT